MITLFHRSTDAEFEGPCDVANVVVVDAAGADAGFIGASWGEHDAQEVLHAAFCEPEDVEAILAGWGLSRKPVQAIGGDNA